MYFSEDLYSYYACTIIYKTRQITSFPVTFSARTPIAHATVRDWQPGSRSGLRTSCSNFRHWRKLPGFRAFFRAGANPSPCTCPHWFEGARRCRRLVFSRDSGLVSAWLLISGRAGVEVCSDLSPWRSRFPDALITLLTHSHASYITIRCQRHETHWNEAVALQYRPSWRMTSMPRLFAPKISGFSFAAQEAESDGSRKLTSSDISLRKTSDNSAEAERSTRKVPSDPGPDSSRDSGVANVRAKKTGFGCRNARVDSCPCDGLVIVPLNPTIQSGWSAQFGACLSLSATNEIRFDLARPPVRKSLRSGTPKCTESIRYFSTITVCYRRIGVRSPPRSDLVKNDRSVFRLIQLWFSCEQIESKTVSNQYRQTHFLIYFVCNNYHVVFLSNNVSACFVTQCSNFNLFAGCFQ